MADPKPKPSPPPKQGKIEPEGKAILKMLKDWKQPEKGGKGGK